MTTLKGAGSFRLGDRTVNRMGYGAMQLAGPGVFGPPKDRAEAVAVLREAVACGVDHIDTSDFYGPHVTNQIIAEALHPYPAGLTIVTKVGAIRGADASWLPAFAPDDLVRAVHDNLRNLRVEAIDVVNLRIMGKVHEPSGRFDRAAIRRLGQTSGAGARPPSGIQQRDVDTGHGSARPRGSGLRAEPVQRRSARRRCAGRRIVRGGDSLCALLPARRLHATAIGRTVGGRGRSRRDADADGAGVAAPPRAEHPAHTRHVIAGASSRETRPPANLALPEAALARLDAVGRS